MGLDDAFLTQIGFDPSLAREQNASVGSLLRSMLTEVSLSEPAKQPSLTKRQKGRDSGYINQEELPIYLSLSSCISASQLIILYKF